MRNHHREGHTERGAAMTEYAIAAAIFISLFIVISALIYTAGKNRAESSVGTVHEMAPCIEDTSSTPPNCLLDHTGTKCCFP